MIENQTDLSKVVLEKVEIVASRSLQNEGVEISTEDSLLDHLERKRALVRNVNWDRLIHKGSLEDNAFVFDIFAQIQKFELQDQTILILKVLSCQLVTPDKTELIGFGHNHQN